MGKKASKKFAASGQLKKKIEARHKHQQLKKKIDARKNKKDATGRKFQAHQVTNEDVQEDDNPGFSKKASLKSVDDLLSGSFVEGDLNQEDPEVDDEESDDESDVSNENSLPSVDDLEEEGVTHQLELSRLAEQDPEFYKYLQENDQELLNFNPTADMEEERLTSGGEGEGSDGAPTLSREILQKWQKSILNQRSLKALRHLLIAFRSAAHMHEEDVEGVAWLIDDPSVYQKLVTTALRYTPVVLEHHIPYRNGADGRFKPPLQSRKQIVLTKLVLSHFYQALHLISQMSDPELKVLAINETAKLLPYITGSRKAIKVYLKTSLNLWSSAEDDVRMAAFLSIRRLVQSADEAILDLVLKNIYLTLVRSSKNTTSHTLPSINFMKNSASELYALDHVASYQHAFGYIRQLAIHLRNSVKLKSKEAYKQVYNWQYVHSVDFWALTLARTCDKEATSGSSDIESAMFPLIYPLVQVTLGAVKLIPNSRSYPLHLQLLRSLLQLTQHTHIYISLAPHLLHVIHAAVSPQSRGKSSTLRPLDLETQIRAPSQYLKTRIYHETMAEEAVYIFAEWCASAQLQGSIAFPETIVPVLVSLRKCAKSSKGGKENALVKSLIEHIKEGANWIEERRRSVTFSPTMRDKVQEWEKLIQLDTSPMGKWVAILRKSRGKRQKMLRKALEGDHEILEDS